MSDLIATEMTTLPSGLECLHLRLQAPRANALEPGLIGAFHQALDRATHSAARCLLISSGRNFCSGGDVRGFADAVEAGHGAAYSTEVVDGLQDIVLRLVSMKCLVGVAARGAITGGGAGLVWAADIAVLASDAFLQPYYTEVGFAPDGGWTALLPDKIGPGRTLDWVLQNRRVQAQEAVALGLGTEVADLPEEAARQWLDRGNIGSRLATKSLIWDAQRIAALEKRLQAEAEAFKARIDKPDTQAGMARFLQA